MVDSSGGAPAKLDLLGTFFSPGLLPPLSLIATRKGTCRDECTVRRLRGRASEVRLHGCGQGLKIQVLDEKSIPAKQGLSKKGKETHHSVSGFWPHIQTKPKENSGVLSLIPDSLAAHTQGS